MSSSVRVQDSAKMLCGLLGW